MTATVDDHATNIATLQSDSATLQEDMSSVTTTVDGHVTDIAALQSDTDALQGEVSSMTTTVDGHATDIASLQDDTSSLQNDVSSVTTTVATLQSTVVQLVNATTSAAGSIEEIVAELQLIHDQLDRMGDWDLGSAAVVGGETGDWKTAVDANAVADTMMQLTAKDLAILALLAVTLVLVTALCMGCNQRSGGRKKYEPVSIVSE